MSAERVRIVVGEGRSSRQGLLRSVLTGEGYDVVGEATNPAELARVLAVHKPAVVVLDDGIGATSVAMVKQMLPAAKVVLIWPGDVVPIGGAIKVEPDHVRQELGPAVERLTGVAPESAALEGPAAEPIIEDLESAPVVILPVTPNVDDEELVLRVPDADESSGAGDPDTEDEDDRAGAAVIALGAAAGAAASIAGSGTAAAAEGSAAGGVVGAAEGTAGVAGTTVAADAGTAVAATADVTTGAAQSELNRRLGNVALAGAAVAGALVLALALGGAEVPISDVSGRAPSLIPIDPGSGQGNGENGGGDPGGVGGDGNGGHVDQPDGDQIQGFYPIQPFDAAASPVAFTVPAPDAFLPVEGLEAGPGGGPGVPHDDGTRGYDKQRKRGAGRAH